MYGGQLFGGVQPNYLELQSPSVIQAKRHQIAWPLTAGIKECKQVFYLHRIKVRSEPAILLQERMALFAANFIRWAARWLVTQAQPQENALDIQPMGIERQVQVGAHVSAQVICNSEGMLLKFSEHSAFSGKVLSLPGGGHPPQHKQKF